MTSPSQSPQGCHLHTLMPPTPTPCWLLLGSIKATLELPPLPIPICLFSIQAPNTSPPGLFQPHSSALSAWLFPDCIFFFLLKFALSSVLASSDCHLLPGSWLTDLLCPLLWGTLWILYHVAPSLTGTLGSRMSSVLTQPDTFIILQIFFTGVLLYSTILGKSCGCPSWLRWWRICLPYGRPGFNSWVKKISWRREWLLTPVFLPEESHGQRSLTGYSPWDNKKSDTTDVT